MITKQMFSDCIKREVALVLPERKRSRPMHQRPLWAWIQGAHNKSSQDSKIGKVLSNQCSWPWQTLNASGNIFCHRILSKKTLPWIQQNWLYTYAGRKHQGHYKHCYVSPVNTFAMPEQKKHIFLSQTRAIEQLIAELLTKAGIDQHRVPLRLIFSPELSCLINLKLMEKCL